MLNTVKQLATVLFLTYVLLSSDLVVIAVLAAGAAGAQGAAQDPAPGKCQYSSDRLQ